MARRLATDFRGASTAEVIRAIDDQLNGNERPEKWPPWLKPPKTLDTEAKRHWREAVQSRGVQWFTRGDVFTLEQFVRSIKDVENARARFDKMPDDDVVQRMLNAAVVNFTRLQRVLGLGLSVRVQEAQRLRSALAQSRTEQLAQAAAENVEDDALLKGAAHAQQALTGDLAEQAARESWQ